ncbi:MAG: hypothetical protein AAF383_16415 [Cyanobacteria bacterium P01_A01_bin.83]
MVLLFCFSSQFKQDFGRSNSAICPEYQTDLPWYEKQASHRRRQGYQPQTEVLSGKSVLD